MKQNQLAILFHLLFWTQNIVRNLYFSESYSKIEIICDQLLIAALCYANYFLLAPYIIKKNNKKYYFLWLALFVTGFTLIYAVWTFSQSFLFGSAEVKSTFNFWLNVFNLSFLYGAVSIGSKLAFNWTINQKRNQELMLKKTATQIQLMKSNVNIPFLLSVLDYAEKISKDNPEQAEQPIVLISDVLRYGLYESESASTSLSREIEIIEEYLELQTLINPGATTPLIIEGNIQSTQVLPNTLLRMISLWRTALDKSEKRFSYTIRLQSKADQTVLNLPVGFIAAEEIKMIADTLSHLSNEQFTVRSLLKSDHLQLEFSTITL